MDETSKQLLSDLREPLPLQPGQPQRVDYEYQREGVADLFMFFEPLAVLFGDTAGLQFFPEIFPMLEPFTDIWRELLVDIGNNRLHLGSHIVKYGRRNIQSENVGKYFDNGL